MVFALLMAAVAIASGAGLTVATSNADFHSPAICVMAVLAILLFAFALKIHSAMDGGVSEKHAGATSSNRDGMREKVSALRDQESNVRTLYELGVVREEDAVMAESIRLQAEIRWIRSRTPHEERC